MVGIYWGLAFGWLEFFTTLIIFRLWIYGMVIRCGDIMQYTLKVVKQESGQEQIRQLMMVHGFEPAKSLLDTYGQFCDYGFGTFTIFFESAYLATQAYDRSGVAYQLFEDVGSGRYYRDGKLVVLGAEAARLKETLGDKAFLAGNYDEAESYYTDAVTENPDSSNAWKKLGKTHHAKGNWSKAISALMKALGLNPDDYEALLLGAKCYIKMDELASALELLYDLYYKQGKTEVCCTLMSRIYCVFGTYDKGIIFADYALSKNQDNIDSLMCKAWCLAKQGHIDACMVIISKVLTLDSTNSLAFEYRTEIKNTGTVYAYYVMPETGNTWTGIYGYDAEALPLLKGLKIEYNDWDSILSLITIYIKNNSMYNALTMCEYYIGHKGMLYSVELRKTEILLVFKLYTSALNSISSDLNKWKSDSNLLVCKAFANAKLGYVPLAYQILLDVLEVNPTNKKALTYKAEIDNIGTIKSKYVITV